MPREMSLTSTRPLTLETLVAAGAAVDGSLVPRSLFEGWALQLVRAEPGEPAVAVLTVELSRQIADRGDLERLTGPVPIPVGAEVWFTEATAPWGPAGETGVAIVRQLGALLGARVIVEDGT